MSRSLGRLSLQLLKPLPCQRCSKCCKSNNTVKCDCEKTGVCNCGPDCQCPHCKKTPCPIGPKPRTAHDPPIGYDPKGLTTAAFKLPPFIKPFVIRPMEQGEVLGPDAAINAVRNKCHE
ncbi:uncharacterized protein LOC108595637 isoform X1 [Drosophila busckii]|uniref:uncharacterized protein LOC108595637 isoform X1 n=1 Tax=Drosophila busckii TaxID=30019 RepID=UPI00083EF94F|nr:uncharacterized protein LOC108595637 isoform X1 [Drosophila busckii]